MTEENKDDATGGSTGDSSPERAADSSIRTAKTAKPKDNRSETRIKIKWHADVFTEGHVTYHCMIKNISLNGGAVFSEHNFQNVQFIKLHIFMPPLDAAGKFHTIEVHGKVVCTAYDSDELLFRTNVNFIKFNLESDLVLLKQRLDYT